MATVMAKCSKCKELFEMDEELYRHRKAHGSKINCPACLEKSHINKYKKASETHKKNWAAYDPEARAERVKNAKEGIHNMSDEKKALRLYHSSIATREYMASLDEEGQQQLKERGQAVWNNKSPEEQEEYKQRMIARWKAYTPEEYRNANMTHEDFLASCKKVAETTNVSPRSLENASPTERTFMDDMRHHLIPYQYEFYNLTIHPDFFTLFPGNPVTGARYTNPYHRWDFKLELLGHPMFVDVDGSMHSPKNVSTAVHRPTGTHYKRIDDVRFNESKRPYQRDGLDAYVIQAYEDVLDGTNLVTNIVTGETMSYQEFLRMLDRLSGLADVSSEEKKKK